MIRVLSVILSLWAASVAADHGTENTGNGTVHLDEVWLDGLTAQIARCYNPGQATGGPVAVAAVTFQMSTNAQPIEQTIRLSAPTGRAGEAQALTAARRALLQCGQGGFDLPLDQFSQWQFVEISFYYYVPSNE